MTDWLLIAVSQAALSAQFTKRTALKTLAFGCWRSWHCNLNPLNASKTINQLYLDQSLNWTFLSLSNLFCQFNQLGFSLETLSKSCLWFFLCYPIASALQTGSFLDCQMACCVVPFLSTDLLLNSFSARGLLCQVACCAKWLACPTANSIALLHYRTPFCIVSSPTRFLDVILIEHADGLTSKPRKCNSSPAWSEQTKLFPPSEAECNTLAEIRQWSKSANSLLHSRHKYSRNLDKLISNCRHK